MKEFEKLKYEIDLISKGEHNQEFTGVYQRLTELTQALQLLQTDVSSQRELLIAFLREQNRKHHITMFDNDFEFADRLLKAINSY